MRLMILLLHLLMCITVICFTTKMVQHYWVETVCYCLKNISNCNAYNMCLNLINKYDCLLALAIEYLYFMTEKIMA